MEQEERKIASFIPQEIKPRKHVSQRLKWKKRVQQEANVVLKSNK